MVASAAAQPIGFPPYVPPCEPFGQRAMSSAEAPIAEIGNPDAMPLAITSTSGTTAAGSIANIVPVRANPVWTSSATKRIPCSLQMSCTPRRKAGGAGM